MTGWKDPQARAEDENKRRSEALEAEFAGDSRTSADMSQNDAESVRDGAWMSATDAREKLEKSVRATVAGWRYLPYRSVDVMAADVLALLDRQAAITERETADMQAKVDKLTAYVDDAARDYAAAVKERDHWKAQARHWQLVADSHDKRVQALEKELRAAKAPHPYTGKDGKEIAVGDTVWGEDGAKWRVTGIRWGSSHPVQAVGENGLRRDLKASWCTHERPDSWQRVAEELRDYATECGESYPHEGLAALAERIERLSRKNG